MYCGYEFGRGRGPGRGLGPGRGMGLGFRGASPPWPYVGRGRGGLPRCWHFFGGAAHHGLWRGAPFYWPATATPGYAPYPAGTSEDEVSYLREQADAIKADLEGIETRIRELEAR